LPGYFTSTQRGQATTKQEKARETKNILARSWWQDDSKAFKLSCHHDLAKPGH
jgi:hypothetical protein